tara:strand:+ start:1970 stop:2926 length:957 start_codon:yes stop_codon:yes gene_type:complete
MKHPKGKGFPFKDSESPLKDTRFNRWGKEAGHAHNEDGTIDWKNNNDQFYYTIEEDPETGEEIGTSTDYSGTPEDEMTNVDDNMTGRIETGLDWSEAAGHGNSGQLIEPSLDPDAESILGQQAREREESGAHRYSRGNQPEGRPVDYGTPERPSYEEYHSTDTFGDDVSYPWDNPLYGLDRPEYGSPPPNTSAVGSGPSGNTDTFGDDVSSATNRPKPTSPPNTSPVGSGPDNTSPANTRPNTSPANTRPNTSPTNTRPNVSPTNTRPTTTDIFGNVVSPVDGRGTQVPYSTVRTPGKFSLGRKNKPTKNNRSFRKNR